MAVDFKSRAAGERDDPDDADLRAARAFSPDLAATMGSEAARAKALACERDRLAVLDALQNAAETFERLAESCCLQAETERAKAREAGKRKEAARFESDAQSIDKRAQRYRQQASEMRAIRKYVLAHPLTETSLT